MIFNQYVQLKWTYWIKMNDLEQLRKHCKGEEFDYSFLMSHLKDYAKPRDKVTRYLKEKSIIRVKKGLYIFGESWREGLISAEILANLIYGPSYISLEYALSYYGLIPERVEQLTSITTQKNKQFSTPVGMFTYHHLQLQKYQIGIRQEEVDSGRHFLIASKEKALADLLSVQKPTFQKQELWDYLIDGLRIDSNALLKFNRPHLKEIALAYHNQCVNRLYQLIKERHE